MDDDSTAVLDNDEVIDGSEILSAKAADSIVHCFCNFLTGFLTLYKQGFVVNIFIGMAQVVGQ